MKNNTIYIEHDKEFMQDLETIKKQIIYRSNNRGFKETDLLIGSFANKYANDFSLEEAILFAEFLEESDPDLFDYLSGKVNLPSKYSGRIFELLLNFNFAKERC